MLILLIFTIAAAAALIIGLLVANNTLTQRVKVAEQQQEIIRRQFEADTVRVYEEAQASLAESQKRVVEQLETLKQESARVRQHYLDEARKIQATAKAMLAKLREEIEPLRKYEHLKDAEAAVRKQLTDAINQATTLRAEATSLLDAARKSAKDEQTLAKRRAAQLGEQADARLDQAIREAGRIIADAEKQAKQIGGDAYIALRDKQMLEQAAQAMRNIVEGYGDRYLIPTHSLLDDLAAEYGYDAAAQSLASAREQTRRMVEQGQAADCDYVEPSRRSTAIQFVIHAFNGSVDAILSRTKSGNYGQLAQKIRDVFSIVNRDGSAFRNARILPAFLDARLSELKWAVVVQELAQRDREEQRYLKEQERDRLAAEKARLKQLQEAERETELRRSALAEAESRLAAAHTEERAKLEQEVLRLKQEVTDLTQHELTIAQQTVKGRIYVISNIGSFGEGVYKIGMTRRPAEERVDELSSASVPFEFDIHGVIETNDAPALEYRVHQQLLPARINKINLRKEFYRVGLDEIRKIVDGLEVGKEVLGAVTWTEKAKAQQYFDSLDIERDPSAKEKWLKRTRLLAERRKRDEIIEIAANDDADEQKEGELIKSTDSNIDPTLE